MPDAADQAGRRPETLMPRTIPALMRRAERQFGAREALVDGEVQLTFSQLSHRVARVTRALIRLGLRHGDRVAVWAPNSHYWVSAALGAQALGGVVVPLNTRYKGYEAADILRRTRAKVLMVVTGFLDNDYLAWLGEAAAADQDGDVAPEGPVFAGLPHLQHVVTWPASGSSPAPTGSAIGWENFLTLADEVTMETVAEQTSLVSEEDVADIIFTSGTTGRSKGVLSAHRQTVDCAIAWSNNVGVREGDRYLIINPFAHTFGYKAGFLVCLYAGATILPLETFDLNEVIRLLKEERISIFPGPPTIFQTLLDHQGLTDQQQLAWRIAVTGSTTVPERLVERMQTELPLEAVMTGYGLSEAVTVSMTRVGDPVPKIARSAGRAIAEFEIRIRDENGNICGPGEAGEIEVRGPNVMLGYLDDPEATQEVIDADGWLRTGDVGHLAADGYLTVTGRIKDMYIVGGFNVYPAEIEHVLSHMSGVSEVSVIGVADERLGMVGKAFVIPDGSKSLTGDEVKAYLAERLANFKVPKYVEIVDELPRNEAGKVLKRLLT